MKEFIVNSEEECLFYKHEELIRCENCIYWCKGDMFTPIAGITFHTCWILVGIGVKDNEAITPGCHYCGWGDRKEDGTVL